MYRKASKRRWGHAQGAFKRRLGEPNRCAAGSCPVQPKSSRTRGVSFALREPSEVRLGSEGMSINRRTFVGGVSAAALVSSTAYAAGGKYDDGASDKEIKIGHTCPYSGPASAYGVNGKAIAAYWDMINDTGGINGR